MRLQPLHVNSIECRTCKSICESLARRPVLMSTKRIGGTSQDCCRLPPFLAYLSSLFMSLTRSIRLPLAALAVVVAACGLAAADEPSLSPQEQEKFFEEKVRPVLATHCFKCHGEKKQESGLRLDSRAAVLFGADSGT